MKNSSASKSLKNVAGRYLHNLNQMRNGHTPQQEAVDGEVKAKEKRKQQKAARKKQR